MHAHVCIYCVHLLPVKDHVSQGGSPPCGGPRGWHPSIQTHELTTEYASTLMQTYTHVHIGAHAHTNVRSATCTHTYLHDVYVYMYT